MIKTIKKTAKKAFQEVVINNCFGGFSLGQPGICADGDEVKATQFFHRRLRGNQTGKSKKHGGGQAMIEQNTLGF